MKRMLKTMKKKSTYTLLLTLVLLLSICLTGPVGAAMEPTTDPKDSAGNSIIGGGVSALGGFAQVTGGPSVAPAVHAPSKLALADYQNVYNEASALLQTGIEFRKELQLNPAGECATLSGDALAECLSQDYRNFNEGRFYYRFCADYEQTNASGSCPAWTDLTEAEKKERVPKHGSFPLGPSLDVRNKLLRARELFGFLALAEPANIKITQGAIRELGRVGLLEATREIANVHLIFGNEFMVDALDYRFGVIDRRADLIIQQELDQLESALSQFQFAVDVMAHAFNADVGGPSGVYIGDYFTAQEFSLFGTTSERMVVALGEMADRYRQLGDDQKALTLYADAFQEQYVQALALAASADERGIKFMENGGWHMMNNLEQLRARGQAIRDGINPFGFHDEYVPLQTYNELVTLLRGVDGFVSDAKDDEIDAGHAQREFDQNRTALASELRVLRENHGQQLLQMCGASTDYFRECEGGLMQQNLISMKSAADNIRLVEQRLANIPALVQIEQDRAGRVIQLIRENGQQAAALEYAKGVLLSYHVTEATVDSRAREWWTSVENRNSASVSFGIPLLSCSNEAGCLGINFGGSIEIINSNGFKWSDTHVKSVSAVWDPAQRELGGINSLQALQQAATQAKIEGANSEAAVRNILLQQAELLIELDLAINEFNRLAAEHDWLIEQYHNWLNLLKLAEADLAESYLSNPAFRILRDSRTIEAARSHALAAQFAYLAAKALEYEFVTPVPFIQDIYKARTADDVDNFLIRLHQQRLALSTVADPNRYPYEISLAKDLLGLSDENLNPDGTLTESQVREERRRQFQSFVQKHLIKDDVTGEVVGVEIPFTTSLGDNRIFSNNIWNNRIAGVGMPLPSSQGLSINLVTQQFDDIGTPEIILTHGGHATYRDIRGNLVSYVPDNAKLAGYPLPDGFGNKKRTATIFAGVGDNRQGAPSSAFFNLSVAASSWSVYIDLTTPNNENLDITQLEDLEILMDTTGIALPR
jgi:hypothetical protein